MPHHQDMTEEKAADSRLINEGMHATFSPGPEALRAVETFLAAYKDVGDSMPLRYPYDLPPGADDLPSLQLGVLRNLVSFARRLS
jgi:hypothetical protein